MVKCLHQYYLIVIVFKKDCLVYNGPFLNVISFWLVAWKGAVDKWRSLQKHLLNVTNVILKSFLLNATENAVYLYGNIIFRRQHSSVWRFSPEEEVKATFDCSLIHKVSPQLVALHVWVWVFMLMPFLTWHNHKGFVSPARTFSLQQWLPTFFCVCDLKLQLQYPRMQKAKVTVLRLYSVE